MENKVKIRKGTSIWLVQKSANHLLDKEITVTITECKGNYCYADSKEFGEVSFHISKGEKYDDSI